MSSQRWTGLRLAASAALSSCAVVFMAGAAHAQIKEPGAHPNYVVDLEPHLVWQVAETDDFNSDGIGLGLRASIPVMQNGPVPSINNNLAIGFGLDWSHIDGGCNNWVVVGPIRGNAGFDCTANHFFVPIVVQWNFFFTPVVGAFTELGLGIHHFSEKFDCNVVGNNCGVGATYNHTDVVPMFAVGPRFILSDFFAITIRVGYPYISLGASFLL